ncbi:MAG: PDZ domain-containing protein, partial [Balneolaceae bacterium]|nr:PDZ domain-containing protein [Balneolaceae bacterium]
WDRYGREEIPYTIQDLQRELGSLTNDEEFANNFFSRYVHGHEIPDLEALFAEAGFLLEKTNPGEAVLFFGNRLNFDNGAATVNGYTTVGSPAYEAGLSNGDRLISVDGTAIRNADDLSRLLSGMAPGDRLNVEFESLGETYNAEVELAENPAPRLVTYESAGREVTDAMRTFRENWLGSKAGTGSD